MAEPTETVALGRSKRATAGNRMRELLEKAHQEDDDEMFKEVADDDEFEAPQEVRDVYLDEFADTDDEFEEDEEAMERELRKEERRKAKGKSRVSFNPLASLPKPRKPAPLSTLPPSTPDTPGDEASSSSTPTPFVPSLLDTIDPTTMAPSTLLLAQRKQRRDAKRLQRSDTRRSALRASTLRTEQVVEKTEEPKRKGRKALHEGGEVRGVRFMNQAELIAAALEEEDRNKEELAGWLRREEERRELRRVGRKRVKGPRWTWVSRTVGGRPAVEVVDETAPQVDRNRETETKGKREIEVEGQRETESATPAPVAKAAAEPAPTSTPISTSTPASLPTPGPAPTSTPILAIPIGPTPTPVPEPPAASTEPPTASTEPPTASTSASVPEPTPTPAPAPEITPAPATSTEPQPTTSLPVAETDTAPSGPYTRNYLILSSIPGGLAAELSLILGSHVDWSDLQYIPARNRPINRRPPLCPFTGLPAKYKHPRTGVVYATKEGYKLIEGLMAERFVWDEHGFWAAGEDDIPAEGIEGINGWNEAVNGGWQAGIRIPNKLEEVDEVEVEQVEESKDEVEVGVVVKRGVKRKASLPRDHVQPVKRGKGKANAKR
ncbi:YL1 nuclear protein-domain-containing protein [Naematelia encephala]|uniref:YL1 nuclear protein-domain-containing protein n=1 Tax=Naematelia encephala TaxID=71784 RepID=A0A1Y2AHC9_9TREE|nr:YL1 nuclear protein-domain-containing protein [Naematelia encephala]